MNKLKTKWFVLLSVFLLSGSSFAAETYPLNSTVEDWKGGVSEHLYDGGLTSGVGVLDRSIGFTVVGQFARKIIHDGFIPEINNQVFAEVQLGSLFVSNATALIYSAHLRWDFTKDYDWTFFALGGLSGTIAGDSLGNVWSLAPRFGVGSFYRIDSQFSFRAELSQDLVLAGVSFGF